MHDGEKWEMIIISMVKICDFLWFFKSFLVMNNNHDANGESMIPWNLHDKSDHADLARQEHLHWDQYTGDK